jgi:NitT/TauT family transport system ATP-binding protein
LIELNVAIKNKRYANSDSTVLAQVDFSVKHGEIVAIIGPSGCGKTTLLNMISGLEVSSEQTISYRNGLTNNEHHRLGYIFQ